jgi:integrase
LQVYLKSLRDKERAEQYVRNVERQCRFVFQGLGARVLGDLRRERLREFLESLPTRARGARGACSERTKETYRVAACAFTSWLSSPNVKKILADPLAGMDRFKGVAVRVRRALGPDELQRLLNAARERPLVNSRRARRGGEDGKIAYGEDYVEYLRRQGIGRALAYKMAVLTLARFGAIRRLTVDALHLDDEPPHAVFPARNVKGRRLVTKALHPSLVQDLREWLQLTGRKGPDRVFDLPESAVRELRKDLAHAGIPYKDGLGRSFDFHAFKKSGITALARAKVDVLKVRDLAEHKDVRLTTTAYHDAMGQPMDEVFAGMPKIK